MQDLYENPPREEDARITLDEKDEQQKIKKKCMSCH